MVRNRERRLRQHRRPIQKEASTSPRSPNNQQISIIGGANNTNDLGFGDSGRGRFMNFGPSGGITSSQRIGLNFNVGRTDSLRFGGNIFYSHSDRRATSRTDTQFLFPDSVSYSNSGSSSIDRGHNVSGNFRLEWKIDANNTLDFRPSFSHSTPDARN